MSELQIFNCEQGTDEWFRARMGIPTASEFGTVMTLEGKKKGEPSITRQKYMYALISERMLGEPAERAWSGNRHTQRGHRLEPEARKLYGVALECEPFEVGFLRRGNVGCSPDSLVGDVGMVEIKTRIPELQIELLLKEDDDKLTLDDLIGKDHAFQLQGNLFVAERKWIDYISYWPGLPLFIRRVYRDEVKMKSLALGIEMFMTEMAEIQQRLEAKAA